MKLIGHIKRIFSVVILLSVTLSSFASDIKPAIWKVEHQGTTSYLLGSIHIGMGSWYPLPAYIMDAFNASKTLVVELDGPGSTAAMTKQMMLPAGQTLQSKLSPTTYQKLELYMKKMGMPAASLKQLKPWAAATVVAVLPYLRAGLDPQFGIDAQFLSRAKKKGMALIELETAQFQITLLSDLFSDEKMLVELLEQPQKESQKLIDFWKEGDITKLEELIDQQMTPNQHEIMLTSRNEDWVKKLRVLFKNKTPYFVVVGAAHLIGSEGVPALLLKAGVKVTRLQ